MKVQIREVGTVHEREQVYRFRYRVYVEEMGRVQKYADHDAKRVVEPLDEGAHIYAAWEGKEIVATIRFNYADHALPTQYSALYQMDRFAPFFPRHTSVTTKLMVAPEYRGNALVLRLFRTACARAIQDGIRFDFMDCNSHLVPFFRKVGYRQIIPNVIHPEYGEVHPMVCVLHDIDYLRGVGSVFASVVERMRVRDRDSVQFFYDRVLPEALDRQPIGLTPEQRKHLLDSLCSCSTHHDPPIDAASTSLHFDPAAKAVLARRVLQ